MTKHFYILEFYNDRKNGKENDRDNRKDKDKDKDTGKYFWWLINSLMGTLIQVDPHLGIEVHLLLICTRPRTCSAL